MPLPARPAARRRSAAPDLEAEVRRLQLADRRRELTIECLVQATLALRRGTVALREENRELRLQVERLQRRSRRDRDRSA